MRYCHLGRNLFYYITLFISIIITNTRVPRFFLNNDSMNIIVKYYIIYIIYIVIIFNIICDINNR